MKFITSSAIRLIRWTTGGFASCLIAASALGQTSITQTTPIVINDATSPDAATSVPSAATPYPSSITTTGLLGSIERVTVQLNGVTHPYPDDINVLLKSRTGGKTVQLMSDAGGRFSLSGVNLTFADAGAGLLPDEALITSGIFKPTDYNSADGDVYPGGPAGPFGSTLAGFINDSPNDIWDLFVVDDTVVDGGSITSWTLNVFSSPTLSVTNTVVTTAEDVPLTLPLKVKDSDTDLSALTFEATSSNLAVLSNTDVKITGTGEDRIVTINPNQNANGTANITITAKDGIGSSAPLVLQLTVSAVNDAPAITLSTNKVFTRCVFYRPQRVRKALN